MNGKPGQPLPAPVDPDPAWVRWWRANPVGKPLPHVETKGKRKATRRARKGAS